MVGLILYDRPFFLYPRICFSQVDRLHHKASPFSLPESNSRILELHGTLHFVHCTNHRHTQPRDDYQSLLGTLNPEWERIVTSASGGNVKTNPDGDVELGGASYEDFIVPECGQCKELGKKEGEESIVKPNVVFFGETIADKVKKRS